MSERNPDISSTYSLGAGRFEAAAPQFIDWYETLGGYIRQEVTRYNLLEWLPRDRELSILDFGGGDARDAIWLAQLGHRVRVVDESPRMLDFAQNLINRTDSAAITNRISLTQGGIEKVGAKAPYDVILSHEVLMYELQNPQEQLNRLADSLQPGGILSLLTKGYNAALRSVKNLQEWEMCKLNGVYEHSPGLFAKAYRISELEQMLGAAGLVPEVSYGIQVLGESDDLRRDTLPGFMLMNVITDEIESVQDPIKKHDAQRLQLIATKP